MRLVILITILFFYVTPIYTQEGSKIDLKNVNVASERLPTIFLFGDEYTGSGVNKAALQQGIQSAMDDDSQEGVSSFDAAVSAGIQAAEDDI